jgi:ribosomal protein S15P/S13E
MPRKAKEKTEESEEKVSETSEENSRHKKVSEEEFEKKVKELAKSGLTSEKIGEKLRKEGIHPKEYNKKISKVLGSEYESPDMKNIQNKLEKVETHFSKNKKDKRAMRDKVRIFAQLRRLKNYLAK